MHVVLQCLSAHMLTWHWKTAASQMVHHNGSGRVHSQYGVLYVCRCKCILGWNSISSIWWLAGRADVAVLVSRRKKEEQKRKKDQAKILGKHGARTKLSFKLG